MRSTSQRSVTVSPVTTAEAPRFETWKRSEGEFVIPIYASAGPANDLSARAGVVKLAQSAPQAYSIDNPPAVAPFVDVYFTADSGRRLACDIRGQATANMVYDFVVNTDMADTAVRVSLPDLSQVPKDKSVTLVDVAAGKRIYARTTPGYSYNSGQGGPREFRLEIGPGGQGALVIAAAGATANRAGAAVTYTLSREACVAASVINISGHTVRVLCSGKVAAAGINTQSWDLRNAAGALVPAGRYMVRIQATAGNGQRVSALAPVAVQR